MPLSDQHESGRLSCFWLIFERTRLLFRWCSAFTPIHFFNWKIVDLQYCVSFKCTKWFSYTHMHIYIHTHTYILFFCFSGPYPGNIEVPRQGIYTITTATRDPCHICDLYQSSWQLWNPSPLSQARNWTCIFLDTTQIRVRWAMMGTPMYTF